MRSWVAHFEAPVHAIARTMAGSDGAGADTVAAAEISTLSGVSTFEYKI